MLTQLSHLGKTSETYLTRVTIKQTTTFYREGSALQGDLVGGPVELVTKLNIESNEPEAKVRRLIKAAEASCFALQSMAAAVPIRSVATLNAAPLALD